MNPCESWQEMISAVEPLSRKDGAALEAHLTECPACRRYRDTLLALAEFSVEDSPALPAGFADGVMAAVRKTAEEKKRKKTRKLMTRWGSLAAALVVAFLGVRQMLPARMAANAKMMAAPAAAEAPTAGMTESFAVTEESDADVAEEPAEAYRDTADMAAEKEAAEEAPETNGSMLFAAVANDAVAGDDTAFLEETVLPGSLPAEEVPARDSDYILSGGEDIYDLWLEDGKVVWQKVGEETVFLSPAAPEDVENYLFG